MTRPTELVWSHHAESGLWWPSVYYSTTMEAYSRVESAKSSNQWMRKALKEVATGQATPVIHFLACQQLEEVNSDNNKNTTGKRTKESGREALLPFQTNFMDCMSHNTRLVASLDTFWQTLFRQACGLAEAWMPGEHDDDNSNTTTNNSNNNQSGTPQSAVAPPAAASHKKPPQNSTIQNGLLKLPPSTFAQLIHALIKPKYGWKVVPGCGKPNLYVKPGCNTSTGTLGIDYFDTDSSMEAYCRQSYQWKPLSSAQTDPVDTYHTPDHPTKPQDPAKPLIDDEIPDPEDEENQDTDHSKNLNWNALWEKLSIARWKKVRAWDRKRGHYYLRPGIKAEATGIQLGVDYFDSKDAVMRHVQRQERGVTIFDGFVSPKDAQDGVNDENQHVPRKRKAATHVTPPTTAKRLTRGALQPVLSSNKKLSKDFWWKQELPPTFEVDIWPLLQRLEYRQNRDGSYVVPSIDGAFYSATGLSKFIAYYGLPHFKESCFSHEENKTLDRWRRFINVPRVHSPKILRKAGGALSWDEAYSMSSNNSNMGLHVIDGKIFDRNMDKSGRVSGRKRGIHYYTEADHNTAFRVFLRDRWIPEKEQLLLDDRDYLRMRLFGATTSKNLPDFDKSRLDEDMLEILQATPDPVYPDPLADDISFCAPTPITTKHKKGTSQTKGPWFQEENLPTAKILWPSLEKIGFTKTCESGYCHPQIRDSIKSSKELQQFIVSRGIPNAIKLSSAEFVELTRWARFAFVEYDEDESSLTFQTMKVLEFGKLHGILVGKLGFATLDGNMYPPGSDEVARGSQRVHKVHYFREHEIKAFIQRNKSFYIGLSKDRQNYVDQRMLDMDVGEMNDVRLTCALYEDEPLPEFSPDAVPPQQYCTADLQMKGAVSMDGDEGYTSDDHNIADLHECTCETSSSTRERTAVAEPSCEREIITEITTDVPYGEECNENVETCPMNEEHNETVKTRFHDNGKTSDEPVVDDRSTKEAHESMIETTSPSIELITTPDHVPCDFENTASNPSNTDDHGKSCVVIGDTVEMFPPGNEDTGDEKDVQLKRRVKNANDLLEVENTVTSRDFFVAQECSSVMMDHTDADITHHFTSGLLTQAESFDYEDDDGTGVSIQEATPSIDVATTTSALPPLTQPDQDDDDDCHRFGDSLARLEPANRKGKSSSFDSTRLGCTYTTSGAQNSHCKSPVPPSASSSHGTQGSASVYHSAQSHLTDRRQTTFAQHSIYLDSLACIGSLSPHNGEDDSYQAFQDAQEHGTPTSVTALLESIDEGRL